MATDCQAVKLRIVAGWVRPKDAAKRAGVDRATVYRWAASGLVRTRKGNVLRVSLRDVILMAS